MSQLKITFIVAPTDQGKQLYSLFEESLRQQNCLIRGLSTELVKCETYNMMTTILACFNSDVVIFDGSVEEEHKQYFGAVELLKGLDYALIVSRTILPFNFKGLRQGGAPGYIKTGHTEYDKEYSNNTIIKWLWKTLADENLELPRSLKTDLTEATMREMGIKPVAKLEGQMIENSFSTLSKTKTKKTRAFVSYLSRYSQDFHGKNPGEPHVEDMFNLICQKADITSDEIDYFPPGVISLEFMTGQRRFSITSLAEPFIRDCRSFWIYDTPDYAQSWWAYAELIYLAYLYHNNMKGCPDLYVVHPFKNHDGAWIYKIDEYLTSEEKQHYLPHLSEDEVDELETLYMNSNPMDVAYEHLEKMRWYAKWPKFILRFIFKYESAHIAQMTKIAMSGISMSDEEIEEEMCSEIKNFDKWIRHVKSYGYSKKFWDNHVVECPICRQKAEKMLPKIYLHFKADYFKFINSKQYKNIIKEIMENGKSIVKLPCGHTVSVSFGEHYYRWWTVKTDVPTGPNGELLERIDFLVFD